MLRTIRTGDQEACMRVRIVTIGHSNRPVDEFVAMLAAARVEHLVDIRRFPGSRRQPQFGQDQLPASVGEHGIAYEHAVDLGGRRGRADCPPGEEARGDGWRNASFRAYARYTASQPYQAALERLIELSGDQRVAIMCSEAVPWRCHRWLVADTLVARDREVVHAIDEHQLRAHELTSFAVVEDDRRVAWPGPESGVTLRLGPRVPLP
jgi:uncharacterized protein (DUF488 family)